MKAAVIYQYGTAEALKIADMPMPIPKEDEILVKVHAASVNPIDWRIRKGQMRFAVSKEFPKILGVDLSGVIVEKGSEVAHFKVGEQVFAMLDPMKGGAYAEYVAIPARFAATKPEILSFEEAAAVPGAGLSALQGLRDEGKIHKGSLILINGAAGGVGTFAVQIAKAYGADVTAVCSPRNVDLAFRLGADRVIDYKKANFIESHRQYDLIFDVVGNASFFKCRKALSKRGIYLTTLPRMGSFLAYFLTKFSQGRKAKFLMAHPDGKELQELRFLIEQEAVLPVIDRIFPFEQIAEAHAYSEGGHARGKIVLKINTT